MCILIVRYHIPNAENSFQSPTTADWTMYNIKVVTKVAMYVRRQKIKSNSKNDSWKVRTLYTMFNNDEFLLTGWKYTAKFFLNTSVFIFHLRLTLIFKSVSWKKTCNLPKLNIKNNQIYNCKWFNTEESVNWSWPFEVMLGFWSSCSWVMWEPPEKNSV